MRGCLRLHTAAVAALRAGAASRYGVRGCSSGVGRRRPLSERLKAFYGKDPAFKARAAALEIDRTKEGIVQSVGAGSVSAEGLTGAKVGEVVTFEGSDAVGIVLSLTENDTRILIVHGAADTLSGGQRLAGTGRKFTVPSPDSLLGCCVTAGGIVSREGSPAALAAQMPGEGGPSTPVLGRRGLALHQREPVQRYLHTGIKVLDAFFPLGHGTRTAIVGPRGTGKSTMVLDAACNFLSLSGPNARAVMLRSGPSPREMGSALEALTQRGVAGQAIVVRGCEADDVGQRYAALLTAEALAEEMREQGHDTLLVLDSLSAHEEAFTALGKDVRAFLPQLVSLYSGLLDRACQATPEHGGTALTALAVVDGTYEDAERHAVVAAVDEVVQMSAPLARASALPAVDARSLSAHASAPWQPRMLRHLCAPLRAFLRGAQRTERAADLARELGLHDEADTEVLTQERRAMQALLTQPAGACVPLPDLVKVMYAARYGAPSIVLPSAAWAFQKQLCEYVAAYSPEASAVVAALPHDEQLPEPVAAMLWEAVHSFTQQQH